MTEPELNLEDFMATAMAAGMPSADLQSLAEAHPALIRDLANYDPFDLMALFGGLLTVPELQSNCIRLEALCHLAIVYAHSHRKPNAKVATQSFAALESGPVGQMEDPAEDVFVTSVATKRGNFRVLEGIWESAGFFLQRFVNIIDIMPEGPGYDDIRESVYALLKLSDVVCARAKLIRWQMGGAYPIEALPPGIAHSVRDLCARVTFTGDDLAALGIPLEPLREFVFRPKDRDALAGEAIGHTALERRPVLWRKTDFCLGLPTGVSAAIRRFILERMDQARMREDFLKALGQEYALTLSRIPLLGGEMHIPIRFHRTKKGAATAVMMQVDTGRYLTFVFVLDTLEDVETTGIAGLNDGFNRVRTEIAALAKDAADAAQRNEGFRSGVTLFVSCGIGRGIAASLPNVPDPRWRQEFLSVSDLVTLSWTANINPLCLWRLLDAKGQIERERVHLQNANGLLNLVAWQRRLQGNLVPHNQIPDDFVSADRESLLVIEQAGIKSLRQEVAETGDPHVAQDISGNWIAIRKLNDSLFDEDAALPLYSGAVLTENRFPPAIYLTSGRTFWCELSLSKNTTLSTGYERWQMLNVWLARMARVLDARLSGLPAGPLLWRVEFEADLHPNHNRDLAIGLDDAIRAITVSVDHSKHAVILRVAEAYEAAHFNVENIAERALVERTVQGFLDLAGVTLPAKEVAAILAAIIPDVHARQIHAFRGQSFRDHVRQNRNGRVILIDADDSAALRLGLGWRVRDRNEGCDLYGKSDCTAFLNAVIRMLEDELSAELAEFNRAAMIKVLLRNHEVAAISRDRWRRTASAVVALRDDKAAAFVTIAQNEGRLNAVFQCARSLIEVAQCDCPEDRGYKPGELDLSRLMAKMALIIHLGGWSDAMWHESMEARVHINPLGDVQVNHNFIDAIIEPFGRAFSNRQTKDAISSYADHLADLGPRKSVEEAFESEFLAAFREECGAGLDEVLLLIDFIEDLGIKRDSLVLTLPRSALLAPMVGADALLPETAAAVIQALTLPRREKWRTVPDGYDDRDRQPWRYRRRLSVLRKPLVQLDDKPDPTIMVAPGLLRDGVHYAVINYHHGDFPQWQLAPKMRSWRGKISDRRGTEFNTEVAERLKSLGWSARADVNMSTILGSTFKALGDIDVLAWNPLTRRVLVIECKDVKFSKTIGEIAEQLTDFRGELRSDGKPDDLLRHLNRMDAIRAHLPELTKYLRLGSTPAVEGHIVFRNPVPMQFAWDKLTGRIGLHQFELLAEI